MKKLLFYVGVAALITTEADAAVWRVNNITGVDADFTTLTAAVTAASAGDTIYLEPSTANYGGATIDKKLTVIGNGYFNTTGFYTAHAGLQANATSSSTHGIIFNQGSEFSTFMGCYISGDIYINASNINIKRNYVTGLVYFRNQQSGSYVNRSNIDIRQNVLIGGFSTSQFSTNSGTVGITNVNIQNNIISQNFYAQFTLPAGISGFIMNNTLYQPYTYLDVYNFQINNNIMLGGAFNPNNNVYFNNIATGSQFGNANNNLQNITTTALFTNYGTGASDSSFVLNPSGPGIGAGFNGVDVGPYGGPDPYRRSGIPPVPTIYELTAPATTTTSTLPVTISTRSND